MLDQLLQTATRTWGAVTGLISLLLGVVSFFNLPPGSALSARAVLMVGCAVIWVVIILSMTLAEVIRSYRLSVSVVAGGAVSRAYPNAKAIILVKSNWFLSHSSIVSVYEKSGVMEHLIAIGQVVNIQDDGNVQIALMEASDGNSRMNEISQNRADVLKSLIVKPTIPHRFVDIGQ